MTEEALLSVDLPGRAEAAGAARKAPTALNGSLHLVSEARLRDAQLLVGALVANAVRHPPGARRRPDDPRVRRREGRPRARHRAAVVRGVEVAVAVAVMGCGKARPEAGARPASTPAVAEASVSPRFAKVLTRAERRFAAAVARADAGRLTWEHFYELSDEFEALQVPLIAVRATGKASRARLDAAEIAQQAKQRAEDVGLALTEGKRPSLDRLVADLYRLQRRFELAIDRALAAA